MPAWRPWPDAGAEEESDPIPRARDIALKVLLEVDRTPLPAQEILGREGERAHLSSLDRALAMELVYGVLRNRSYLDWVLARFSKRPLDRLSPVLREILRLSAYQVLFLDRIPAPVAVSEGVCLARRWLHPGAAGYANGVLRALIRTGPPPPPLEKTVDALALRYSHPPWLVARWVERYGWEKTRQILERNNRRPPLTLRVHTLRCRREDLARALQERGLETVFCRYSPDGLRVEARLSPKELPGYQEGWFVVQDEASQLVAYALAPQRGERILDACAAPGGKTTHLAALMQDQGEVLAVDREDTRLQLLLENQRRLGIQCIRVRPGDVTTPEVLQEEGAFDRILVDAPCSGLGILRRHPEGRWRKQRDLVFHYARIQARILDQVWAHLKPGGIMVYSTCSTEPEENEWQIQAFAQRHPDWEPLSLEPVLPKEAASLVDQRGFLFTLLMEEDMDGFFVAAGRKRRSPKG